MELDDLARRVDDVQAQLAHAASRLVTPRAQAMGADSSGSLGELGRALSRQADAAVAARVREARALGDAVMALAASVRSAVAAYADAESGYAGGPFGASSVGGSVGGGPIGGGPIPAGGDAIGRALGAPSGGASSGSHALGSGPLGGSL